ncbi:response regulator transcription factor [Sinimarinibacterium thermocellulolyticum]|uniref:Response regulator transcription factor n=1 Tax=Sinimarinibacterium thermocellulolyticum TaxID=3170016 RepID=A0ABV2A602_9GAMM
MKILLIDDHELFRAGLKLLLANLADGCEFAEAADLNHALALAGRQHFDIVLLDFRLPGPSGFEALAAMRAADEAASIVVLSGEDDPLLIRRVIDAGASGFIPKASSHATMMAALQLIIAGGSYLPPHVLSIAHDDGQAQSPDEAPPLMSLTDRQREALRLAMQGKSNKVIAREMDVSEATVKAHLSAAFRALRVHNRTEAVYVTARLRLTI